MIVDELARVKASLQHRSEQYDHHVRLLLHKHSVLWNTLSDSNAVLSRLRSAFDPLTVPAESAGDAASLLGMADKCRKLGEALTDRLVGGAKVATTGGHVTPRQIDTPAEEELKVVN